MIKNCRSCKSNRLTDILSLGNQYLSDFVDIEDDKKPDQYPLDLALCNDCQLLQLKNTTAPELLYTDHYGYQSGVNQTMRDHLKDIVEKAKTKVNLLDGDIAVDIGCNDYTLLHNYPDSVIKVGFDPIAKFKKYAVGGHFINSYFNEDEFIKNFPDKKAKVITAISMFYDLDDPNKFISDIVKILADDGVFIIQQNYLVEMLRQHAFDNIVHEHLEYYSLTSLEHLLNRHELEVFDAEVNDLNGGSFRVYIRHMNTMDKMRILEKKLKLENKWTYLMFGMQINAIRNKLRKFIKGEVEKGKTIYIYGASTRGNTLLQYCGLDNSLIKAAIERNPEKWGKKIASVGIPIISEEQSRKDKPDYLLILPWHFLPEFLSREKEYLDNGGHFIVPLPEFKII